MSMSHLHVETMTRLLGLLEMLHPNSAASRDFFSLSWYQWMLHDLCFLWVFHNIFRLMSYLCDSKKSACSHYTLVFVLCHASALFCVQFINHQQKHSWNFFYCVVVLPGDDNSGVGIDSHCYVQYRILQSKSRK